MQCFPNWRIDGRTLTEQTLADRSDGEDSVESKHVCVRTTDSLPQPSKFSIISSYMHHNKAHSYATGEARDAHSQNKP